MIIRKAISGGTVIGMVFILSACAPSAGNKTETVTDSDVVFTKADIQETVTFIPVSADGVEMEILAVKASDGTIRTAFNTCQVCYNSGKGYYEQEGDVLVCQNCGNRFSMDQVSVEKGGCNPVGISEDLRTETDTEITIPLSLIQQAEFLFTYWKTTA